MGMGMVEESNAAVWVGDISLTFPPLFIVWDPMPVGALTCRPGLDGNEPLPKHVSRVYY